DRYPAGTGTATGSTNNTQGSTNPGTATTNQSGTGYAADPGNTAPTAGATNPYASDPFYGNPLQSNMQDPRAQAGTGAPMNQSYNQGTGYQTGTNPQGSNQINWPTNQQPIPTNPMPPANYGNPMPPANYNNPPQNNQPGYNPQPPYNNQPPTNYNPPAANNPPANNWPTNSLADNSRNNTTGSQIPKPFLDETDLPRASF